MTQEDKELLLKYLCAALPYGVFVSCAEGTVMGVHWNKVKLDASLLFELQDNDALSNVKPYLHSMSSMTEEEMDELESITFPLMEKDWDVNENPACVRLIDVPKYMNFILSNHFDFMGLIPKGLSLEAPKGMYN